MCLLCLRVLRISSHSSLVVKSQHEDLMTWKRMIYMRQRLFDFISHSPALLFTMKFEAEVWLNKQNMIAHKSNHSTNSQRLPLATVTLHSKTHGVYVCVNDAHNHQAQRYQLPYSLQHEIRWTNLVSSFMRTLFSQKFEEITRDMKS